MPSKQIQQEREEAKRFSPPGGGGDTSPISRRGRNRRISSKVQTAVRLMVTQGLSVAEAAKAANMTAKALYRALSREHVQAWKRGIVQAHVNEWGAMSIGLTAELMADKTAPHAVRLQAQQEMRRIAGVDFGGGKAEIGSSTRLVIEVKPVGYDGQLTVDQSRNVIRAVEEQPLKLRALDSETVEHATDAPFEPVGDCENGGENDG